MPIFSVDGDDLSGLGVTLVDFSPGSVGLEADFATNGLQPPAVFHCAPQLRTLTLVLEICGSTPEETMHRVSQTTARFLNRTEILCPDGFFYTALLQAVDGPERTTECIQDLTLTFLASRHGALVQGEIDGEGGIVNPGNAPCACRIAFTPPQAGSYTVFGYTLSGLAAEAPVVIDGIGKTVTQGGQNIWEKTDLVSFPVLLPGENSLSITPAAAVSVAFYPIYL